MAQPQQAPHQLPMPQLGNPHSQMPQMSQMQQHQQMSQMSPQLAPRAPYSQAQNAPSPVNTTQASFAVNPHKRPRVSPAPQGTVSQPNSQPASPYLQTAPYAMSPQGHNPPATTAHSPNYSNAASAPSPQSYSAPYTNGNIAQLPSPAAVSTPVATTPSLHLPTAPQTLNLPAQPQTPMPAPIRPATPSLTTPQPQYTTATMAPIAPPPTSNAGTMGPPSKPADKPPAKEKATEYDISDSLAGTGVDLKAEELALAEFHADEFLPNSRTGLPINPPGTKDSMYGAGWANQPGQPPEGKTQAEWEAEIAKQAWNEAAQRLAIMRSNELNNPFCQLSVVHYKADKIAKEYGLSLNLDLRNPNPIGKMKLPQDFSDKPTVKVSTKTSDDGALVVTTGSWLPVDAFLVDQLALLSIATKHRLREMLEDADVVATTRQTTSHGEVPEEWTDVAVPLKYGVEAQDPPESAVSPRTNPLKRTFDVASAEPSFAGKSAQFHTLNRAMRDGYNADQSTESARLKKRQKRLNPDKPGTTKTGATPGTPGGVAPEAEQQKAPAKKETKKSAKASLAAESSNAEANQTVNTFLLSSFGKKKNKYSWMSGGAAASGPSTPKASGGTASAAGSPAPNKPAPKSGMLPDGRLRLGTWREDTEKGKGIQLRDWVVVLERDGKDNKAIQDAYLKLDASGPK
ncbi:hypothetical protein V8F20_004308 [Naviculisporaceae sp. PSN 640]